MTIDNVHGVWTPPKRRFKIEFILIAYSHQYNILIKLQSTVFLI